MNNFLKSCLVFMVSLLLILCCSCNNAKVVFPNDKAPVTENGAYRPITPQIVNDQNIDSKLEAEAILTKEELKRAYSYSYLSLQEMRIYRIMLNMVRSFTVGWVDLGNLTGDKSVAVAKAYRALSNDFPEYFWMPTSYYITYNNNNLSVAFKKNDIEDGYGFTKEQAESAKAEFEEILFEIAQKALKAQNDFEKEVIIHDEICKLTVYDSEYKKEDGNTVYTAYGALVNGRAVCEGYAKAFKLICNQVGLENILVTGNSNGVGHMWNMVKLNGNWYHVDVTFNDLRAEPHHTYLNLTEAEILADHNIDISFDKADSQLISEGNSFNFKLPEATDETMNYLKKRGYIIDKDPVTPVVNELIAKYKAKEKRVEFCFANKEAQEDFKKNYEKYVIEIQKQCNKRIGKTKINLKTLSFGLNSCSIYFE